ncbi:MAG: D-3-phosphoglycerate dehydrogenase / 2-oxoglutarate reductase [Actinomycetota bacterium]|nr:D-3-phosphoglycerate dehydrogenase / 2-oxoglutarate reductase [Actinomycetota bacterium]
MKTAIVVNSNFDSIWPLSADRLRQVLEPVADVTFVRVAEGSDASIGELVSDASSIRRLISLGLTVTEADLDSLSALEEVFVSTGYQAPAPVVELLEARGIRQLAHRSEGFWGQSVSEFALGLTLAALRQIAHTHHSIQSGLEGWDYPFQQFGDDARFTNGTVQGKRVRIVGAGNIASRYASFMNMLGADVAVWDPYASEPAFHRAGARKEWYLEKLVTDAEIFVPMVPLTASTEGLVTAEHLRALPNGCLVVQATRAKIVDTVELRRRVIADELSLAADVFDVEPLPLDDPLLGRANVVHTPHLAGRTKESNYRWAEMLAEQFPEYDRHLVPAPPALDFGEQAR